MKTLSILLFATLAVLAACSGSDTYRGAWKATDANDAKFDIFFEEKSFTVKDSTGKIQTFKYSQHTIEIKNGVETYGITLDDGRQLLIHFPISFDETTGLILEKSGIPVYSISRK